MKIAFILPSLSKKGPILVAYELVCGLIKRNETCVVYYFDEIRDNILDFPCKAQRIKFWHKIDFDKYDVVHTHGLRPDSYVFFHKPFHKNNTRFISTIHNFVMEDLTSEYNWFVSLFWGNLWMFMLKRHDMRVVLSKVAAEYYEQWFNPDQLTVIYNTRIVDVNKKLSPEDEQDVLNFKSGAYPFIGVNAMLTHRKGIDLLLKSMSFLPMARLWVVGDGKLKEDLMQMSQKLGISERCRFVGYKQDAYRYIPYYDVFVMASRSEGFPIAILESVVMHKNIVCSDIPVFKEIFTSDEVSFFQTENVQSLVLAIRESMMVDKSERAYQRYVRNYSADIFVRCYLKVYTKSKK